MSCGETAACPHTVVYPPAEPYTPKGADGSSGVSVSYMQTVPDDFDREELQRIRDRARRLSIVSSPRKTLEERLYQQLADTADQLDAIAARWEADIAKSQITITNEPVQSCGPGCCKEPNW